MRGITLVLMLIVAGCGAREHHEDLKKVQSLDTQIDDREKEVEKRKNEAIAHMALEQRQLRIEIADIKSMNARMLTEMELESR